MSLGTTNPKINQQGKHFFFPSIAYYLKVSGSQPLFYQEEKKKEVFLTVVLTQANKLQEECLIIKHFQPNPQITD